MWKLSYLIKFKRPVSLLHQLCFFFNPKCAAAAAAPAATAAAAPAVVVTFLRHIPSDENSNNLMSHQHQFQSNKIILTPSGVLATPSLPSRPPPPLPPLISHSLLHPRHSLTMSSSCLETVKLDRIGFSNAHSPLGRRFPAGLGQRWGCRTPTLRPHFPHRHGVPRVYSSRLLNPTLHSLL